jgi:hypothetical protein
MDCVTEYTKERLRLLEKNFLKLAEDRFISLKQFQKLIKVKNVSKTLISN